ncbi:thioredoxin-like protein [Crepidotus variabilis]|uniref:Thioredoxin-like protein n=1 Tax=Crepidotus variabilis TaxID=179855 RepID=A0A9P6E659_9AGAR|nr:thioredoxin-like protein [Crepidotus variabilis]
MFKSFAKRLPQVSIFHRSQSPPSTNALKLLRASLSGPYPAGKSDNQPLQFDLEVVESPPTTDQLQTIMSYLPSPATNPAMVLLSAHPSSSEQPQSLKAIHDLVEKNPNALKWPIVVNWNDGKAAIGNERDVKEILEDIRKQRDGEKKDEAESQPKGWFS